MNMFLPRSATLDTIEMHGDVYVAKDNKSCEGCAFQFYSMLCDMNPSYCGPQARDDKRNVIWVKKEQSNG